MMSSVLKTACEWTRYVNWLLLPNGEEYACAEYIPGPLSVEYRTGDDGRHEVVRVLEYATREDLDLPYVSGRYHEIPAWLRERIVGIIQENERNYGRWLCVVRLPGGEVIRAAN